jgi:predicted porin
MAYYIKLPHRGFRLGSAHDRESSMYAKAGTRREKSGTAWRRGEVCLAITAISLTSAGAAADEIDLYGRINVTLQDSDEAGEEQIELRNNSSRIGVKGEKALSAGLKAIYQLEFGVNLDGDSGDDVFTHRNQFVGLEGAFGTIKVGRHDTALKQAQADFDLFDDLEGDIGGVFNGENRLRNYIGYVTPTVAKAFSATANLFPGEDPDAGNDGVADAASLSLNYKTDLMYAAVAYDRDVDGEGVDTIRVVGGRTFGPARVMLLYQRTDIGATAEDGFGASVAWKFGKNTAKFQYLSADIWRTRPQADPRDNLLENLLSVGVDHALGEDTKVFAFYTAGDIGGTSESNRYAAIGIQHNF